MTGLNERCIIPGLGFALKGSSLVLQKNCWAGARLSLDFGIPGPHPRSSGSPAACFCIALSCFASLRCLALRCFALLCIALRCFALHCIALHCFALLCIALHCFALLCIALHCFDAQRNATPHNATQRNAMPQSIATMPGLTGLRLSARGGDHPRNPRVPPGARGGEHTIAPGLFAQRKWEPLRRSLIGKKNIIPNSV